MDRRHLGSAFRLLLAGAAISPILSAAPAFAAGAGDTVVEPVVVTANRRTENVQTAPVSATVLSGDELRAQGIATIENLQFSTPSLTVDSFGGGYDFNIRGIGQGEDGGSTPAGVITYRDKVEVYAGIGSEEPYYDIADIEVLRGPQGTFGGENAIGGAVYVTERNPEMGRFGGYGQVQAGNFGDVAIQGAANLPVSSDFAVRIAMNAERRDSFWRIIKGVGYSGDPGSLKAFSGRVSALWEPAKAWQILFKTDVNYIDDGGYPADPTGSAGDPFTVGNDVHNRAIDASVRSVLDVKYTFRNGIVLRSISGAEYGRNSKIIDILGTATSTVSAKDTFVVRAYSEELNLVSPDTGPLKWIVGAFFDEGVVDLPAGGFDIGYPFGAVDYVLQSRDKPQSQAGFGQVTYDITPKIQVQAGARYTHASDAATDSANYLFGGLAYTPPSVIPCQGPGLSCPITNPGRVSGSKVTGKVALNWRPDETNFFYVLYATGHKAGGINESSDEPPTYRPEDVTSAEIGWKPTFAGGHIRAQVDAYWNDYRNFQVTLFDPQTFSSPVLNAPSAKLWGLEAQTQAVWRKFTLDVNAAYEHTAFDRFFAAPAGGVSGTTCDPQTGGDLSTCQNLSHERLVMAPEWTFSAAVEYAFDLANGATLTPRLSYSYMASQFPSVFRDVSAGGVPAMGARNLVNAQLSYDVQALNITLFATNLTDEHYISYQDTIQRHAAPPRQFGVRLLKTF